MDELKMIGKLLIKDSELAILEKYHINARMCGSIQEVLFLIDQVFLEYDDITDEEYDELDVVASNLQERSYYMETNK